MKSLPTIQDEFALIECLTKNLARKTKKLLHGIGDDCAVVRVGRESWLLTTDMLIENQHFLMGKIDPYQLGRKLLSVNLSDIAAMGGIPHYAVVAAGFPATTPLKTLKAIYAGLHAVARESACLIVGGDTNRSPTMVFSIAVVGKAIHQPILRSGARVGDDLYVTGPVGLSALGLKLLQQNIRKPQRFIEAHCNPKARLKEARWLAERHIPSAMIDISDGLLADLSHILKQSRVGARLDLDAIPPLRAPQKLLQRLKTKESSLQWAGGEDYELLFTAPLKCRSLLSKFFRIGRIVRAQEGLTGVDGKKNPVQLPSNGYNHFQTK